MILITQLHYEHRFRIGAYFPSSLAVPVCDAPTKRSFAMVMEEFHLDIQEVGEENRRK